MNNLPAFIYNSDGVQCSVNNNGTKTTKAKEQRQQPFNRETHSTVNRDTFMYSPALQLKQSIDERKRKESVRSAMKEISDMLSPIDDSSQLEGDYFCHVDAVMNGSQNVENNENNYNFQYQNQNRSAHECPQTDDMMQVESQASNDPLMTLCEAAGEQVELGRDQDSELWGTLPHPCNVGHNWVLFGGEVRLSVPTPVQPMSSLSNRSEGVYPATWTQTNDYDDGDMLAAPEVPASRSYSSAVDHCDSQNSNHVASMFPGLLPPEPTMNHYHMNNTLSHMAAEDGRSEVFSERGETLEALCSFLFSP